MRFVRRRMFILKHVDLARVADAVVAAVDSHGPSRRTIEPVGDGSRVTFESWLFDARAGANWGVYRGIGKGWVEIKPLPAVESIDVQITSTVFVGRAMSMAAIPITFFVVVMLLSRWWLAAVIGVWVLPIWMQLFAAGYVGTFQSSLQKALKALEDEERRGFEVV